MIKVGIGLGSRLYTSIKITSTIDWVWDWIDHTIEFQNKFCQNQKFEYDIGNEYKKFDTALRVNRND